jgi:L-aspartate oxidase
MRQHKSARDTSRALRCDIVRASLEVLTSVQTFDALVLGSGLAGQALALRLAEAGRKVALITKKQVEDSASSWAQGGIAAVLDSADSIEHHISDTLTAGAGLCDVDATRFVVENGREAIEWLISRGVPFTRDENGALGYHLTREGGHSHRRIVHVADATGSAIQATLTEQVRAHPASTSSSAIWRSICWSAGSSVVPTSDAPAPMCWTSKRP